MGLLALATKAVAGHQGALPVCPNFPKPAPCLWQEESKWPAVLTGASDSRERGQEGNDGVAQCVGLAPKASHKSSCQLGGICRCMSYEYRCV